MCAEKSPGAGEFSEWMSNLPSSLHDKPITKLAIPGMIEFTFVYVLALDEIHDKNRHIRSSHLLLCTIVVPDTIYLVYTIMLSCIVHFLSVIDKNYVHSIISKPPSYTLDNVTRCAHQVPTIHSHFISARKTL